MRNRSRNNVKVRKRQRPPPRRMALLFATSHLRFAAAILIGDTDLNGLQIQAIGANTGRAAGPKPGLWAAYRRLKHGACGTGRHEKIRGLGSRGRGTPKTQRCLTPRSSGAPTAGHQAREAGTVYIFCFAGLVAYRWLPLSSNVRPHNHNLRLTLQNNRCQHLLLPPHFPTLISSSGDGMYDIVDSTPG
jgi:hypothetical protein